MSGKVQAVMLVTSCPSCHTEVHMIMNKKQVKELYKSFKMKSKDEVPVWEYKVLKAGETK